MPMPAALQHGGDDQTLPLLAPAVRVLTTTTNPFVNALAFSRMGGPVALIGYLCLVENASLMPAGCLCNYSRVAKRFIGWSYEDPYPAGPRTGKALRQALVLDTRTPTVRLGHGVRGLRFFPSANAGRVTQSTAPARRKVAAAGLTLDKARKACLSACQD